MTSEDRSKKGQHKVDIMVKVGNNPCSKYEVKNYINTKHLYDTLTHINYSNPTYKQIASKWELKHDQNKQENQHPNEQKTKTTQRSDLVSKRKQI